MGTVTFRAILSPAYFLLMFLCVALPVHANIVHKSVAALLHKVEPRLAFEFTDDKTGTAIIVASGEKIDFQLDGSVYALDSENKCFVGILQYPKYQSTLLRDYVDNGVLNQAQFKSIIFSVHSPFSDPVIQTHILDTRALCSLAKRVVVEDILGEGSRQVLFTGISHYPFEDPKEVISAERVILYDVPSLTERLAVTTLQNVNAEEPVIPPEIFTQRVAFEQKTATSPPKLKITSQDGATKEYSLAAGNSDPLPTDTPWIRDEVAAAKRRLAVAPRMLHIQLLDEAGKPIPNLRIYGEEYGVKSNWSEVTSPVMVTTDADGRASHSVSMSRITLDVQVPGYYKETVQFERAEVPENEVQVTLEREGVKVALRSASQIPRKWQTDAEVYEIGLQFGESSNPFGQGEWVEQKENADIWFVAKRTGEVELNDLPKDDNSAAWTVTLEGTNGWDLLEGPLTEDWQSDMREAPAEGYKKTVTFVGARDTKNINFYLRWNGGKRYGALTTLRFVDKSRAGSFQRALWTNFVLQMENANVRSLDTRR